MMDPQMTKPKVIHVITMLELGGAQGNTLFTVSNLDRNKFDVGLIAGPGGIQDEKAKKIPNLKLEFVQGLVRPISPVEDLAGLIHLYLIFKREKPDIVHTHSSKAGISARIAAKLAGVPIIIHSIHGFGFNPYQKFFIRWLFIFLEKWIAKFTDILVAVSQNNIEEGLKLGIGHREQYVLIRSGVDIAKIKNASQSTDRAKLRRDLNIPESAKIVLTIGPFKLQKDPMSFVEIAAKVKKEVQDVLFLWSGDGELRPKAEARIQELGVEKNIKILGWRDDVPALLALCDVFILTSLWEGLPRAGVEALIVGKPVVAFSVDGVPEIVLDGKNGFVLKPGDREGFARRLTEILKDPSLHQKFSQHARQTIDASFDINGMVRSQEDLYDKLLTRARSR